MPTDALCRGEAGRGFLDSIHRLATSMHARSAVAGRSTPSKPAGEGEASLMKVLLGFLDDVGHQEWVAEC